MAHSFEKTTCPLGMAGESVPLPVIEADRSMSILYIIDPFGTLSEVLSSSLSTLVDGLCQFVGLIVGEDAEPLIEFRRPLFREYSFEDVVVALRISTPPV